MVQSTAILSLVLLPSLALAGSSFHQRRHAHHKHQQQQRAVGVHTVVKTHTDYVATTTVTYGNIPSDGPAVPEIKADAMGDVNANAWGGRNHGKSRSSTPAAVPTSSAAVPTSSAAAVSPRPVASKGTGDEPPKSPVEQPSPSSAAPVPSSSSAAHAPSSSAVVVPEPSDTVPESSSTPTPSKTPYAPPSGGSGGSGTPGKVTIQNNCAYDLYLKMEITNQACATSHETWTKVSAGEPWSGPIISCPDANPSYKVSPKPDGSGPIVQYETGYKPLNSELWENISLVDCVTRGTVNGEGIENCVGAPWYLEATNPKSTAACQQYACGDAESCCKNTLGAYCSPVAEAQKALGGLEPVGMCNGPIDEITVFGSFC